MPKGISSDAVDNGTWELKAVDALGRLELSFEAIDAAPAAAAFAPIENAVDIKANGEVTIPLDLASAPGRLVLRWNVQGRSAGISGAQDDLLIGYRLLAPNGSVIARRGKHVQEQKEIVIREPGQYKLVFSNAGILRSTARRVSYQVEFVQQ